MIPALAIGLIIKILNLNFLSLHMIAYTSIIGAVMLLIVIKFKKIRIKTRSLKIDFFIAGLFQCLAFLPGFSRSGSCITAFLLLDKKREQAIKNSLLMSFPIILISFLSNAKELNLISLDINLLIIFIITFISAYLTLLFFIKYINRIGFMPYVIYRILLGSILLIYFS
jgi:undecaprenyl-diphosphatase